MTTIASFRSMWPCFLHDCLSPEWRCQDPCVQYWTDDGADGLCETLTYGQFNYYVQQLTHLLTTLSFNPTRLSPAYRTVALIWTPHLLTSPILLAISTASFTFHSYRLEHFTSLDFLCVKPSIVICFCSSSTAPSLPSNYLLHCRDDSNDSSKDIFARIDWCLFLNTNTISVGFESPLPLPVKPSFHDLAYLIKTSGTSSSTPKIVFVSHACLTANVIDLADRFPVSSSINRESALLASPLTFDPSLVQILFALLTRRCLLVLPNQLIYSAGSLANLVENANLTWIQCTPSCLARQCSEGCQRLLSMSRVNLLLGGERLPDLTSYKIQANVYNIYGVSEVSSWASLYRVWPTLDAACNCHSPCQGSTPIGRAMFSTNIRLSEGIIQVTRDYSGFYVTSSSPPVDQYQFERAFDQLSFTHGRWWSTNDMGLYGQCGNCLWLVGRSDRVVKRFGHQICLDRLEQIIASCRLLTWKVGHVICRLAAYSGKLIAHVWLIKISNKRRRRSRCPYGDIVVGLIKSKLRREIQSLAWLPDRIVLKTCSNPGLSPHGKSIIRSRKRKAKINYPLTKTVLLNECRNVLQCRKLNVSKSFVELGGSSISAILLSQTLLHKFPHSFKQTDRSSLLSQLLTQPLDVFITFILDQTGASSAHNSSNYRYSPQFTTHRYLPESTENRSDNYERICMPLRLTEEPLRFLFKWSANMGKCIDASPLTEPRLLTDSSSTPTPLVYVGSHSGQMSAFNLINGHSVWTVNLGDRIEAKATVIDDGLSPPSVSVGTLSGFLLQIDVQTGSLFNRWTVGGSIKSPATHCLNHNLLVIGSHARNIQAYDPRSPSLVWSNAFDQTPIVAPLVWNADLGLLVGASLGGQLGAIDLRRPSDRLVWSCNQLGPIFAQPLLLMTTRPDCRQSSLVIVGSATGRLAGRLLSDGSLLWTRLIDDESSLFSDPVSVGSSSVLLATSTGRLIELESWSGHFSWSLLNNDDDHCSGRGLTTPSPIYTRESASSPSWLVLARNDGRVALQTYPHLFGNRRRQHIVASFDLPGETFSSPAVYSTEDALWVVVGCRDDNLYTFKISPDDHS